MSKKTPTQEWDELSNQPTPTPKRKRALSLVLNRHDLPALPKRATRKKVTSPQENPVKDTCPEEIPVVTPKQDIPVHDTETPPFLPKRATRKRVTRKQDVPVKDTCPEEIPVVTPKQDIPVNDTSDQETPVIDPWNQPLPKRATRKSNQEMERDDTCKPKQEMERDDTCNHINPIRVSSVDKKKSTQQRLTNRPIPTEKWGVYKIKPLYILLIFCVLTSKNILIFNEETAVSLCFFGFLFTMSHYFGLTVKESLDERALGIESALQKVFHDKRRYYRGHHADCKSVLPLTSTLDRLRLFTVKELNGSLQHTTGLFSDQLKQKCDILALQKSLFHNTCIYDTKSIIYDNLKKDLGGNAESILLVMENNFKIYDLYLK